MTCLLAILIAAGHWLTVADQLLLTFKADAADEALSIQRLIVAVVQSFFLLHLLSLLLHGGLVCLDLLFQLLDLLLCSCMQANSSSMLLLKHSKLSFHLLELGELILHKQD